MSKKYFLPIILIIGFAFNINIFALESEASKASMRKIDNENLLLLTTKDGIVYIELFPEMAPLHVAQMKKLARMKFFDGIVFHRVIEDFMAQGGDPDGTGMGGSELPDILGEFVSSNKAIDPFFFGSTYEAPRAGFYKSLPVSSYSSSAGKLRADGKVAIWGNHCRGAVSMARTDDPNSANSQFFIVFSDSRRLDKKYTIWGKVIKGMDVVDKIAKGEPPVEPTKIISMRVASDLEKKVNLYMERIDNDNFVKSLLKDNLIYEDGNIPEICKISIEDKVHIK